MSFNDAKSKLLGFLVALQAGHASFPPMDKATKCHVVPSTFKLYISLEDIDEGAEDTDEMEVDSNSDAHSSSPSADSQPDPDLAERAWAWFESLMASGDPIMRFDHRDVRIEGKTFRYDKAYWNKLSASGNKLGWPDPLDGKVKVFVLYVHGWSGRDGLLRADSLISHADALNRAFHYSRFYDEGFADESDRPTPACPAELVPFDFGYYPVDITEDPSLSMSDFLGNDELDRLSRPRDLPADDSPTDAPSKSPSAHSPTDAPSKSPPAQADNNPTTSLPSASLKPSSYGKHRIATDLDLSPLQRLLSTTSANAGLLQGEGNSSFLATAIIEPDEELHPVQNMCSAGRIILISGQDIDSEFELWPVHDELIGKVSPLKDPSEEKFPASNKEVVHYMKASPWQLVKVRPGQKGPDGKPKRQPRIYSTIRIHSQFEAQVIVGHLKPDLDVMDIGLNLKDVQLASTEIKFVILGLPPNSCPEGLRLMTTKLLYKLEMKAAVQRKIITEIKEGSAELGDVYFTRKGIKTTRLTNPVAKEKFSVDRFDPMLKTVIVVETPVGRTAMHAHLLNLASESGTIKAVLGERATFVRIPEGNINDPTSVSWMEKVHAPKLRIIFTPTRPSFVVS
jgi:hypothetical protein